MKIIKNWHKKPYHKQYINYALVSFLSEQEAISTYR